MTLAVCLSVVRPSKRTRQMRRFKHLSPFCRRCGYDLRGVKTDRCPECDEMIPQHVLSKWSDPDAAFRDSRRRYVEAHLRFPKYAIREDVVLLSFVGVLFAMGALSITLHHLALAGLRSRSWFWFALVVASLSAGVGMLIVRTLRNRLFS